MDIKKIWPGIRVKITIDPKDKENYKDFNSLEGVVDDIDSYDNEYPINVWIEDKDGKRTGDCPGFKPEELEEVIEEKKECGKCRKCSL